MIIANVTGPLNAGTPLSLSCHYTLSTSVDTEVTASATWTVNDTVLVISDDDGISSDGVNLIFSPLTTSHTGTYTCTLTLTPSPQTPHVTVQGPGESPGQTITVQSKVHSIHHVIVFDLSPFSLSP